jgi:hypothetical protein
MATKKLIIEAEVKTDQLDKAVQKLGQLKDLGRGLKIQYDIDGKPLDVIIDKSKNLQQQFKLVTAELKRTKEGTAEFALLAKTQANIQDGLARTKAKSGDLLTSLQLLPGPVGEFASKLNGAIALLKTFTSFSLKDLRFQFKETINDITDVIDNVFGLNKAISDTGKIGAKGISEAGKIGANAKDAGATTLNTGAEKLNTAAIAENTKEQVLNSGAKLEDANDTQINSLAVDKNTLSNIENNIIISKSRLEFYKNSIAKSNAAIATGDLTAATLLETDVLFQESLAQKINTLETEKNILVTKISTTQSELDAAAKTGQAVATNAATTAMTRFVAIITSVYTAITGIVALIGIFAYKYYQLATATTAAEEATKTFKETLLKGATAAEEAKNKIIEVGVAFEQAKTGAISKKKALETYNEVLGGTIGKADTLAEAEKLYKNNTENYIKATGLRAQAQELFRIAAQKSAEAVTAEQVGFFSFDRKLGESYDDELKRRRQKLTDTSEEIRKKASDLLKEAGSLETGYKPTVTKGPDKAKIENDNKAAAALLLKLQQENSVNILNEERKKQDAQLKIDKQNEEREVNNLKLSKDKEELRAKLLEQIRVKYGVKVIELNKKRQEEDNKSFDESQKKIKEYNDKVFEIMNAADESEIGRNKATLERKYADDVAALQKDTEFQKQSKIEQERIITLLEKAKNQALQKLDDDDAQNKRDKNLKRLDDELKFLQIRGDALIEGTKSFYNNQRAILKAAEQKEFADLEDRAIKEKLTEQQIADAKEEIRKKYLKMAKDITKQELQDLLQAAQATLGVAQTIAQDIGKVAQIEQQVAMEEATKRYIKQNELDKKTITNQEQLEKKLIENKKKFAQEEDDIKRKAFEENKKIQIAQAIIATLQSAVGAFSSLIAIPIVGPVLAPIAAASALVFGYKQVAAIKRTQYQSSLELSESESSGGAGGGASCKPNYGKNYADGGLIGGKRHAQGGTMIEAEQGEAIMTRGAVTQFAPLLSLMNQAGGGTSFNSNLMTTRQDNPILSNPAQEQAPLIVKTYVVSQELTTEAHKQARLKNLSTI